MKCALIIPPWLPQEIFSNKTAGSQINYWQPLGTLYVAAALRQAGHEVRFYNGAFLQQVEIIVQVTEFAPDFIGLYSTTFGWRKACEMATALRRAGGNFFLAVGGPFPIATQEQCLERCPELDAVITGEGEFTSVELLSRLATPSSVELGHSDPARQHRPIPRRRATPSGAGTDQAVRATDHPLPSPRPGSAASSTFHPSLNQLTAKSATPTTRSFSMNYQAVVDLSGVLGVIYRDGAKIVKNPPRPLISDLDALPFPARDLLGAIDDYVPPPATYKRRPVAVIITSRGCNRHCLYCFQIDKARKSGIRYRSMDHVMAEIRHCLAQGYREIKFIDDTLTADYHRAMELARRIREEKLDFTWFASACVNQVDQPLLQAFKDAGCWAILFGAESGVQKDLNTIRKGITLAQIRQAVAAGKKVGITVYTPFIFGIPGQSFADGLKTIEFALELDPDIANFHALTPFPGTELWDNLAQYGAVSQDLSDYTYQGAAFVPYTMTREEIGRLRQIAFKRFYSRPKFLWRRLLALRGVNDLKAAVNGLKSLFWLLIKDKIFQQKTTRSRIVKRHR